MSSSRCSPSESGRARRVIDGEGRAPVSPTTSQLAQLPSELLTIVLTYLPLPFKFHSVTHLSRHFPQLTASAFQHDHLNLSYPSLLSLSKQWPRSLAPFAQLRSMILLSCDVIVPHRGAQLGPLVTRVLSPSPTVGQPFSALRALSLTLPNNGTLSQNRTLHSVYESFTTGLPLLHTLRVVVSPTPTGYGRPRTGATALVSGWLCRLPSLRRLTIVSMELEARSLLTLFSLPLLSLDLHDSHFSQAPQYDGGYSDEALQAVSGTLRRLALPSGANNTMWAEHVEQLLRRYAERRQPLVEDVKQVEEEKLHVAEPSAVAIQPAWQLRCLRFQHHFALDSFFDVATPASLPRLTRLTVPVTDLDGRRVDRELIQESCLAFFPSFAAQLRHLTLTAVSSFTRCSQRLFASVLTCTELVSLNVISDLAMGDAFPLRDWCLRPMRQLKKLLISAPKHRSGRASHLQHADVARLLTCCPLLSDLTLRLPNASINLLPAIARSCRQLCKLTIRSDDVALWDANGELTAMAAQPPDGAFGLLHTLHIDHDLKAGQNLQQQPSAALLAALSALLCHAPIRRLCLVPHVDVTNIPFYAAFPHLVRLRLHSPQLRAVLQHYCHPPDSTADAHSGVDSWLARTKTATAQAGAESHAEVEEAKKEEEDQEEDEVEEPLLLSSQAAEEEWLTCPAFITERLFAGAGGLTTGREAWLERGREVAAAETERRRLVALEKARLEAEKEAKRQKREVGKGKRKKKAEEGSAADAFFAASGIRRKR